MKRSITFVLIILCLFTLIPLGAAAEAYPAISLKVPSYKQMDSRWGKVEVGRSGQTMAEIGCAVTSLAMTESYRTGKTVTPAQMEKKLGFTPGGALYWPENYSLVGRLTYRQLYEKLKSGVPVIAGCRSPSGRTHFVVIRGYAGGDTLTPSKFLINDPGSSTRTTLAHFMAAYPSLFRRVFY